MKPAQFILLIVRVQNSENIIPLNLNKMFSKYFLVKKKAALKGQPLKLYSNFINLWQ
jgi:hypothetical protein